MGSEMCIRDSTGDGKGKSSAAFGVMVRALALDWPVAVVQFIKSGDWKVGEEKMGRQLGVDWNNVGDGFTWDSDNMDHDIALAGEGWAVARDLINAGEHRLVILDEITYLLNWGWVDTDEVVKTSELRGWLETFAEAAYQSSGSRRIKNPRIWSLHDLAALTEVRG